MCDVLRKTTVILRSNPEVAHCGNLPFVVYRALCFLITVLEKIKNKMYYRYNQGLTFHTYKNLHTVFVKKIQKICFL